MKFTPSEDFLVAARSAGRIITPKISIKKTASRSEPLSTGTWNDVTDYISRKDLQAIASAVEINLSQYSADKISLTGLGIAFWDTTYFSYANFLELKVEYIVNNLTSEPAPIFAGWVEKKKNSFVVKRSERSNTVKFTVWSYIDYADNVHASTLLAQYIDNDVDGAGTHGLILPHIQNLFVTNANVATFVLRKGIHIINYQLSGSDKQAKLDDGDWVTLSTGSNTLVNNDGSQKVTVYARSSIPTTGTFADDIIVNIQTDTLPKNWHTWISVQSVLKELFNKIGITNVDFDTLEYPTATTTRKISFLDCPPQDLSITGNRFALYGVGTDIYIGVGNKLVKRNMVTNSYATVYTLGANEFIVKMLYNARNDHLWICYGTSANGAFTKVRRYYIGLDDMSDEVVIASPCSFNSVVLMDYEYGLLNYKYCLCYILNYKVREIDGNSFVDTLIWWTNNVLPAPAPFLLYIKNDNELYASVPDGNDLKIRKLSTDGTTWSDVGFLANKVPNVLMSTFLGAYHEGEDKLYYYSAAEQIEMCTPGSATSNTVFTPSSSNKPLMMYYGGGSLYTTMGAWDGDYRLYSLSGGSATLEDNDTLMFCKYGQMFYDGSLFFGLDSVGRLFQFNTIIALYIETADCEGLTIRGAIDKACSSFSLVYKVNSTKRAIVHRRSDENGDVITSGNTAQLNSDNMRDVTDNSFYADAYDIIKVSNGRREVNYDGSVYDAVAFDEELVLPVDSDWIPDEILEDLAYNLFLFFSVAHKVYLVPSPEALMQFESLDGATIQHDGNMVLSESGAIVNESVDPQGRMEFKVLVNA